ncbi:MAG: SulP family inorganic anion transporter [Bdellovibrionota bacterium]
MGMFRFWRSDLQSSLVVFLVALPLCLGIALASGAPMSSGLVAGIIGGIVVGALSGSPISVSGPAAGLTVIVASSLQTLGSFDLFMTAVFLSGIFQVLFSVCRGGVIGDYFPSSVIRGMLAAIGLILILKQFPHAVGYDADYMGDESFQETGGQNTFSRLFSTLQMIHWGAIMVSLTAFLIIVGWEKMAARGNKFFQLIPGALIAVFSGIVLTMIFQSSPWLGLRPDQFVSLPLTGVSDFKFFLPSFADILSLKVVIVAFTISLVGSLESLLSVDAADKLDDDGRITDKNRELLAQGVGNTLAGLCGGLPITAVIVRTSANSNAGAKTRLSAILHSVWLLLAIILIPMYLNYIPLAALATILILVGYKLTKPKIIKEMYKKGWASFIPFMSTIIAILLTDLLTGIAIGMVIGFFFVVKTNLHKAVVLVQDETMYLLRFHKDVSFLQKSSLQRMLRSIPEGSSLLIDGSHSVYVDNDIIDVIEEFVRRAPAANINVTLKRSSLALCPLFKEESYG